MWINILGGAAVLGSYVWGLATHPGSGNFLWGGVPQGLRIIYTISMLLAALGYLTFTAFLLFRLDPEKVHIKINKGFGSFYLLYVAILIPSALWMPLTFLMLAYPSNGLWLAIRVVLAVVGLASLGMLSALLSIELPKPSWFHRLAVVGCILLCIQTALLDALVWTAYFRV